MAQIPLRDYLSGIEELIDGDQIDDALAHCRQILRSYPKHVDTYRMMGKAYLEAHRHSEASDIFQRVLSTCPDDFVSHIGTSIIREEAGDQDGAIWNMERAFEAQPSNRAVQDELRRLYGKREGYTPPKVRLTRGALARMYAHGDLYNQAISELVGALAEDPQRPDLQVLLAEMYFKTDRQTEAMDVCSQLIEKLPYCLYANQVMAEILTSNQRDVQAQPYLDRVKELDPYAAQVKTGISADSVPADSVDIEQLILESPAAPQPIPKAWTGALQAADSATYGKEDLPDWLSFEEEPEEAASAEQAKEAEEETGPTMLGSLESLEPAPPADVAPTDQAPSPPPFSKIPTAALVNDQVPDWLRELGPATGTLSSETIEETDELKQVTAQEKPTGDLPPDAVPAEEAGSAPAAEDDGLGWLERLAADQGAAEAELLTTPEERQQASPEWAPAEEADKAKSDTLTWLDKMETEAEKGMEPQPVPTQEPAELPGGAGDQAERSMPSWLKEMSAEAEETAKKTGHLDPYQLEEASDWLKELRPPSESVSEEEGEDAAADAEGEKKDSSDLSRLDWMDEAGQPEEARQSEWVPEAEMAGSQGTETPEAERATTAAAPSPRRTARLEAEELAEGELEQARQALNFGKLGDAADHYGHLLRRRLLLDDVIADLEAAVHRTAGDATLWQTLGDAYMRNSQLREALECYNKAESLL